MLFHDVMKKLENDDLKILASYLEGSKTSKKVNEQGKRVDETKEEFVIRFIEILVLSATKDDKHESWNIVNDILSKLPEVDIKILIAYLRGSISSGAQDGKKEMIGGLITFIHDVVNSRMQKEIANAEKG